MTTSQHMVRANGLRFRTMVDGPAGGEMLILLHGFPEGAESWSSQVSAMAEAGHLAVAPDLRGYGLSDAPEGVENYAIEHLVQDVAEIITAFGRSQAHVAGHDWGAIVAWFFAARHAAMTKTLTVLSVAHPAALAEASDVDADQQDRSRYVALFLEEGKAERVLAEEDCRRLRAMFTRGPNPGAVPPAIVEHFARSLSRPGRLTAALNYYRANLRAEGGAWSGLSTQLRITAPTMLLWGDEDPALGRRAVEATAGHVQGPFELVVLEGGGHWLQFERPVDVNRALAQNLQPH